MACRLHPRHGGLSTALEAKCARHLHRMRQRQYLVDTASSSLVWTQKQHTSAHSFLQLLLLKIALLLNHARARARQVVVPIDERLDVFVVLERVWMRRRVSFAGTALLTERKRFDSIRDVVREGTPLGFSPVVVVKRRIVHKHVGANGATARGVLLALPGLPDTNATTASFLPLSPSSFCCGAPLQMARLEAKGQIQRRRWKRKGGKHAFAFAQELRCDCHRGAFLASVSLDCCRSERFATGDAVSPEIARRREAV